MNEWWYIGPALGLCLLSTVVWVRTELGRSRSTSKETKAEAEVRVQRLGEVLLNAKWDVEVALTSKRTELEPAVLAHVLAERLVAEELTLTEELTVAETEALISHVGEKSEPGEIADLLDFDAQHAAKAFEKDVAGTRHEARALGNVG